VPGCRAVRWAPHAGHGPGLPVKCCPAHGWAEGRRRRRPRRRSLYRYTYVYSVAKSGLPWYARRQSTLGGSALRRRRDGCACGKAPLQQQRRTFRIAGAPGESVRWATEEAVPSPRRRRRTHTLYCEHSPPRRTCGAGARGVPREGPPRRPRRSTQLPG
jgi:hypothetical protein